MNDKAKKDDPIHRLWTAGSELTGAASGASLGLFVGGPPGAIIGAGAGAVFGSVLKEVAHRVLSRREQVRIGAVFQYAEAAYQERLDAGETVRKDGFFATDKKGRTSAAEAIEGVLVTAQRQYEERKIEYLGYLLANVVFAPRLDGHMINWAIKMAGELAWAQLAIMALVGSGEPSQFPDVEIGKGIKSWSAFGMHQLMVDLGRNYKGLMWTASATPNYAFATVDMSLRSQKLRPAGQLLHDLMWLDRIPADNRAEVLDAIVREDDA